MLFYFSILIPRGCTTYDAERRMRSFFLATKFALKGLANGTRIFSNEPEYIRKAIDESLQRLQTNRIDLWYWSVTPSPLTPKPPIPKPKPLTNPQPPLRRQSPRRNHRLNHSLSRPLSQSALPRPLRMLLHHPPRRHNHPRRPNRILPLHPRHRNTPPAQTCSPPAASWASQL